MVKWNEAEVLASLSSKTADWEGRLSYKSPKLSGGFSLQAQGFKVRIFILDNSSRVNRPKSANQINTLPTPTLNILT